MSIDQNTITFILGIVAIMSIIFQVYNVFRKPQIDTDKTIINLNDRISNIEKGMVELKETHLRAVENDIKNLTSSVNELSKTVVRLSTIIDERIPKGSPNLTPPGK